LIIPQKYKHFKHPVGVIPAGFLEATHV